MLRSSFIALALLTLTAIPAAAQLVGNDTAPGDSCSDKPAGATRMTADSDQDGGSVTLICDGAIWQVEANDIQDGLRRVAVETDPCTTVGQLAQSSAGDLLVCKNAGDISGESCSGFSAGAIALNSDGSIHSCMNASQPNPCAGSPSVGTTCSDGSVYAGLSPDGDVPMYTTPADATSTYTWNDGTANYTDTTMENCTDTSPGTAATCQTGEANTTFLVGATGEPDYPFAAAGYCDGLSAHGHNDWYLPALDELNVLFTNRNTGDLNGTFDETGSLPASYYWSSSEFQFNVAWFQRFDDGTQFNDTYAKFTALAVRCVRR